MRLSDRTEEHPYQMEMLVAQDDYQRYGEDLAKRSGQPPQAGKLYFSAHAMNHFFAFHANEKMYGESLLELPTDPVTHLALVEAVVSVPTAWVLDQKGYDGDRIVREYFAVWESQLKKQGEDPTVAQSSAGAYYTLKKMDHQQFKKYVKNYDTN